MNDAGLKPGSYRIAEIAEGLNVARCTIERYIKRLNIPSVESSFKGKPVKLIQLDDSTLWRLVALIRENKHDESTSHAAHTQAESSEYMQREPDETIMRDSGTHELTQELEAERARIRELQAVINGLENEKSRMQEIIDAKQQAIEALQAAVMIQGQKAQPEAVAMIPAPKGMFARLRFILTGE